MPEGKTIWFLVSTVALCNQQCEVLRTQIPAASIKILTSDDGVDSWSTREIWDAALADVRIVTAPYQILFDALSHGFVQLGARGRGGGGGGGPGGAGGPRGGGNAD